MFVFGNSFPNILILDTVNIVEGSSLSLIPLRKIAYDKIY